MTDGFRIEKLRRDHPIDDFTCGSAELDRFLIRFAFANQQANASQTWLGLHGADVVGFYTLVVGEVAYGDAPERSTKGLARHPVPIVLLARLGIRTGWQAADIAGIRAFAVHAKDDSARRFYEHFGFVPSPADARHLFLLLKDLRQLLAV
jgi:GNAT superfamily N-acetyltransferase